MKKLAAHHQIFMAGSLLLKDEGEIYNTALLIAPDGETWRYDKRYPFGWERAYFKEGTGTTIADTELGKLGLMICWDIAHVDLWQAYAGQVDAMVIMSCPPLLGLADFVLPNQRVVPMQALGPGLAITRKPENYFADGMLEEQSAWLGVPTLHASGAGRFSTHLDKLSLGVFWAARPDLWRFLGQADAIFMEADYGKVTKILDAQGHVIAKVDADGDGFTLAEIELADERPQPSSPQPKARVPAFTRWAVDKISVGVSKKHYEKQRHLFAMRSTL
jgi:hypothetical protein